MAGNDILQTVRSLKVYDKEYSYYSLKALDEQGYIDLDKLPYTIKILIESLLREYDGDSVTKEHLLNLTKWGKEDFNPNIDFPFIPTRVLLQDFTGVPVIVDFASMRKALADNGGDPSKINPRRRVDLVIDHSVQVDKYGSLDALDFNTKLEYERNEERYKLLNWAQKAFANFKVVPPSMGIVHQINLEYLADLVSIKDGFAFFDTLVGTDSHTPMVNGLGVLGWGVGGIEAEAGMLGLASYMQVPDVIGVKLTGKLKDHVSATDLTLKVTQLLRGRGVVGAFVEYFGPGIKNLTLADRATLSNMSPEYGATCGFFPVDEETLKYLALTGREKDHIDLVEKYTKENGLFYNPNYVANYTDVIEVDLSEIDLSLAGPKRPQDRILLKDMKEEFNKSIGLEEGKVKRGDIVIAAITSCTNTSNPYVMIGAGLVAKKAYEKGLKVKDYIKTSLAPGSKVVTEYLKESGLMFYLEKLGFALVGYGCTTCIGNSGPLKKEIEEEIIAKDLSVSSVLSGNRNFEGRIHPLVKANYLASPPLVVAYAIAGTVDFDFESQALGKDKNGEDVFFKDIWPSRKEINDLVASSVNRDQFIKVYDNLYKDNPIWNQIDSKESSLFDFDETSTYIQNSPFFDDLKTEELKIKKISGIRVLAYLGDSVTTDHISPAGSFSKATSAGKYLLEKGIDPSSFNSYGARRGNHKVMMRGTFANIRIRNKIAKGLEGGYTTYWPNNETMSIYDASQKYKEDKTPLLIIAGSDYGMGSSRDWAAKGPSLLGVKAVLAKSYERIHRSNLILMGLAPLQFVEGQDAMSLGLVGDEVYTIYLDDDIKPNQLIKVESKSDRGTIVFDAIARFDSVHEIEYFRHGGILQMVLRKELS